VKYILPPKQCTQNLEQYYWQNLLVIWSFNCLFSAFRNGGHVGWCTWCLYTCY